MLFNSLHFILFFPLAVAGYFATPRPRRWLWLVASSYYFYMCWKPEFVLLIICSTLVDYFAALAMEKTSDSNHRKRLLVLSLTVNLGLLAAFKYLGFFTQTLEQAFSAFNILADLPTFKAMLPVGISFYTFQTLSYIFEVYRGNIKAERRLGYFAAYVAFWPQLVAGPIERPDRLLPQLHAEHHLSLERLRSGLSIMLWGFFQKLVIADRLAVYVDAVYAHPETDFGAATLWLATYGFAFQIYCDFSGYSLIAIGAARVMGIDLMTNFRRPYWSRSIGEFWRRWHISLSSWFKDYVYIPMGGSRVPRWKHARNLMVTFAISGLWHGAGWTFVVWGALHGTLVAAGSLCKGLRSRLATALGLRTDSFPWALAQCFVAFHLVVVSWVFFRAEHIEQAFSLLHRMFWGPWTGAALPGSLPTVAADPWIAVAAVIGLGLQEYSQGDREMSEWLASLSPPLSALLHITVTLLVLWLGVFTSQAFIYFQF